MTNTEWLDNMLDNKVSKEATIVPQGENREDHMERKVKAFDWIKGVSELDPVAIEAEYNEKLRQEALMLGKKAALDEVIADGTTPEEVVNRDYKRDVASLSDYALAELLAEARGHKAQNTNEMYYELKEKAKAEVAAGRDKAEKALLELIPDNAQLDWQKAFKEYKKEEKPADPKEKDLYKSDVPEKAHDFEHPSEDKFKLPKDPEKALPGNGREADERKEVTQEAGVLKKDIVEGTSKDASLKTEAHCGHCGKEAATPPGGEHVVKELKKNPKVDNPWAVAWSMKNKGDKFKKADYDQSWDSVYPKTADGGDSKAMQEAFRNMCSGAGEDILIDLLMQYMPEEEMRGLLNDFSDEGVWSPGVEDYEQAGVPTAVSKLLVNITKKASACPLCGGAGEDLKNNQKEHLACKSCNLTYAEAKLSKQAWKSVYIHPKGEKWQILDAEGKIRGTYDTQEEARAAWEKIEKGASQEITSHATKEEVIQKVAELQKKAEVPSPWAVTKDEQGNEVIARVAPEATNTKESEEEKKDEIQK